MAGTNHNVVETEEDFLSFAWNAYTRDVGHPPGWDWRERVDAIRKRAKVEVVLPRATDKYHSVRFDADEQGADVRTLYLMLSGLRKLGNPGAVKVTVEAYTAS